MDRDAKIHLVISYLEGTLEQEKQPLFEKLLADDAECAGLFYRLSLQHMLLHKIGKEAHTAIPVSPFRRIMQRAVWAAAAVAVAAGVILFFWADRYPPVKITGDYVLSENEGSVRNGSVAAGREKAECILGGYCTVTMDPDTLIRIQGGQRREAVFLEKGAVTCEVDPGRGSFEVRTECGTVRVKGTVFSVRIHGTDSVGEVYADVEVEEGEVEVVSGEDEYIIAAGESLAFPELPEPAAVQTDGGPMVRYGDRLYAASGAMLCVIDCSSKDVLIRKDLSGLYKDIDPLIVFKGSAVLVIREDRLIMMQNGYVFVFDRKTLKHISTLRIGGGKRTEQEHSIESGETDDIF